MTDKKIIPQQEPKEPKAAQAVPDPGHGKGKTIAADEMQHINFTAAGEPLPINPDTGEIDIDNLTDGQRAELEEVSKAISEAIKNVLPSVSPAIKSFIETNLSIADKFSKTEVGQKLNEFIQDIHTILQPIEDLHKELNELEPYLIEEMAKPGYKGKTFDYLKKYEPRELVELRNDPESFLSKAIEEARKARDENNNKLAADAGGETLPEIHYNKGTTLETSTTKLTTMFFSSLAPPNKGTLPGQIGMGILPDPKEMIPVKYEKTGAKEQITLFYDYTFNLDILKAIGLDEDFDAEDVFIMSICDTLYLENNRHVSLNKIYRDMTGRDGNERDLRELENRLKRGGSTSILINDKQVREAWGVNTDKYDELFSPVIPVQVLSEKFSVNGNISRSKVNINGLSPFYLLSRNIKQITTWDKEILTAYTKRRTPRYWRVLNYLMQQIGWMRNPGSTRSNKITYSDLYNSTGEKTKEGRRAAKNMMFNILDDVFVKLDYIKYYKEDTRGEEGILIKYTKKGNRFNALPAKK